MTCVLYLFYLVPHLCFAICFIPYSMPADAMFLLFYHYMQMQILSFVSFHIIHLSKLIK